MALREWQVALGSMVEARASGRQPRAVLEGLEGLSEAERAWLNGVVETPGFELTSYVPRWWRQLRVARSARLTLAALGGEREEVLRQYLRSVPCSTLYFLTEGLAFLEFVARTPQREHVRAVARLERALLALKQAVENGMVEAVESRPGDRLARHPLAALVPFQAPVEAVLGALLTGAPLPAEQEASQGVLVAPGLQRLWRPATPEEARAFLACEPSADRQALSALPGSSEEAVAALLAAGALRASSPDTVSSPPVAA